MASTKLERLTKAVAYSLDKYKSTYDTRQTTIRKLLAKQIAKDILEWYEKKETT